MAYRLPIQMLLVSMLCITGYTTHAAEVYKWTGADGSTHYSQTPPVTRPASIEKLSISVHTPEAVEATGLQTTLEVAKQLEVSRLERERLRLERRKAHLEKQKLLAEQAAREQRQAERGPVYYLPVIQRPHRPHKPFHHKPHPHRPHPFKPGHGHQHEAHPVTIPQKPGNHRPVRPGGKQNIRQARVELPRR